MMHQWGKVCKRLQHSTMSQACRVHFMALTLDFHKMRGEKKTVLHDPGVMDWMFYCLGQGRKTRKTHEDIAHVETSLELELNSSRLNRQHPWQNLIIKTVSPFTINKNPVLVSFNRIIRCLSGWHGQSCFSISCNLQ